MKQGEVEVLADGIKVGLGGDYWVVYDKAWNNIEIRKFRRTRDDLAALAIVLGKAKDWNVPDSDWNPLPFDREKLLAAVTAFQEEKADTCWAVPAQLQLPLVDSYYKAYSAACSLPLDHNSPSTSTPA